MRLAAADIALEQAQHSLGPRQVGIDLADGALLRVGQTKGQGAQERAAQPAIADNAAARGAALVRTHEAERQLAGQQLVECEPSARGRLGADVVWCIGLVQAAQRAVEARPSLPRQPGRILPLRQFGQPRQRFADTPPEPALAETLGQRIQGLERTGAGELVGQRDQFGVYDLPFAPEPTKRAAHYPLFALGQDPAQVGFARLEEHEVHNRAAGRAAHLVGQARTCRTQAPPSAWRRAGLMPLHADQQGHPLALAQSGGAGLQPALDQGVRQMPEQIQAAGIGHAEQPAEDGAEARADAAQSAHRSQQLGQRIRGIVGRDGVAHRARCPVGKPA